MMLSSDYKCMFFHSAGFNAGIIGMKEMPPLFSSLSSAAILKQRRRKRVCRQDSFLSLFMMAKNKKQKNKQKGTKRPAEDGQRSVDNKKTKVVTNGEENEEIQSKKFHLVTLEDTVGCFLKKQKRSQDVVSLLKNLMEELNGESSKVSSGFKDIAISILNDASDGQEDESLVETLKDLESCWKNYKNSDSDESNELVWADVLIDLIISFLPRTHKASTVRVAKAVKRISSHVTPAVAESFVAALMSTGDDEDEDGDSDNEGEENDSKDNGKGEDDDDEENDEAEPDSEDEEKAKELEEFKTKLYNIFNEDEDNDEADDEEMFALDEALGEAFREKMGAKKEKHTTEQELNAFKSRVLRVFEALIPEKDVNIELVLPVIPVLIRLSVNRNFYYKARATIKLISKTRPTGNADPDIVTQVVKSCLFHCRSRKELEETKSILSFVLPILTWTIKVEPSMINEVVTFIKSRSDSLLNNSRISKDALVKLCDFSDVAVVLWSLLHDRVMDASRKEKQSIGLEILSVILSKITDKSLIPQESVSKLYSKACQQLEETLSLATSNRFILSGLLQLVVSCYFFLEPNASLPPALVNRLKSLKKKQKSGILEGGVKALKSLRKIYSSTGNDQGNKTPQKKERKKKWTLEERLKRKEQIKSKREEKIKKKLRKIQSKNQELSSS